MSDVSSIDFRTEDDRRDVLVSVSLSGGGSEDELAALDVTIDADGVHAERGVLTYRGDGFDTFFEGLAADWKGWTGTRRWDAAEHGMSIEATHHGGRVELLFILRQDYDTEAWELRVPIRVAPGETLSAYARAAGELVAGI